MVNNNDCGRKMKCCLSILIFLFEFSGVISAVCSKEDSYGRTFYFNCSIGCCGSIRARICCNSNSVNKPRSTGPNLSSEATAGIVISAFAFVGIVLIVTICYNKKYGRARTVAWRQHGGVTVHTITSSSVQPYPMYTQAYPQRMQTGPRDNVMGSMHPRFC